MVTEWLQDENDNDCGDHLWNYLKRYFSGPCDEDYKGKLGCIGKWKWPTVRTNKSNQCPNWATQCHMIPWISSFYILMTISDYDDNSSWITKSDKSTKLATPMMIVILCVSPKSTTPICYWPKQCTSHNHNKDGRDDGWLFQSRDTNLAENVQKRVDL